MPQDKLPVHVRARIEGRDARLAGLGFASYRDYLRSPRWFDIRRAYRESDLPQQCMCGADEVELHHLTYDRVGEEELTDLRPLCSNCHQMIHQLEIRGVVSLDFDGYENGMRAYLYRVQRMEAVERAAAQAPPPAIEAAKARRVARMQRKRRRRKIKKRLGDAGLL